MPKLRNSQPDIRDDSQKLSIMLHKGNFEDAESLAYSIYRRLSSSNGYELE